MAVKEIVKLGHPVLKRKCKRIEVIDDSIRELIQDLKDTLYSTTGVGLAAPQINVPLRVVLVDLRDGMEPIVMINPRIRRRFGKQEGEEGCLSYPDYYGTVVRPRRITVFAMNEQGEDVMYKADGFLARAFCHEIDHLDGIMFTDHAENVYKDEGTEEEEDNK